MNVLKVTVDTVDSFQGSEKEVIVLSTVRANDQKEVGFASNPNRMNVSITRARRGLVVLGQEETLSGNELWNCFIDLIKKNGQIFPENSWNFALHEYPEIRISDNRSACVTLMLNPKVNKKIGMVLGRNEGDRGNMT